MMACDVMMACGELRITLDIFAPEKLFYAKPHHDFPFLLTPPFFALHRRFSAPCVTGCLEGISGVHKAQVYSKSILT
jgi:hypothetical protein